MLIDKQTARSGPKNPISRGHRRNATLARLSRILRSTMSEPFTMSSLGTSPWYAGQVAMLVVPAWESPVVIGVEDGHIRVGLVDIAIRKYKAGPDYRNVLVASLRDAYMAEALVQRFAEQDRVRHRAVEDARKAKVAKLEAAVAKDGAEIIAQMGAFCESLVRGHGAMPVGIVTQARLLRTAAARIVGAEAIAARVDTKDGA